MQCTNANVLKVIAPPLSLIVPVDCGCLTPAAYCINLGSMLEGMLGNAGTVRLYVVLDTSVLLTHWSFLQALHRNLGEGGIVPAQPAGPEEGGPPTVPGVQLVLLIPWAVLVELDKLKEQRPVLRIKGALRCTVLCCAVLGWAGLGWAGLGWAGLGWAACNTACLLHCCSCQQPICYWRPPAALTPCQHVVVSKSCLHIAGPTAYSHNTARHKTVTWAHHLVCNMLRMLQCSSMGNCLHHVDAL